MIVLLLIGCKTQEEIRREQLVDSLANQMRQGQNVSANMTVEVAELKKQILQLQGMIEESGQQSAQSNETRMQDLFTRVQLIEEQNKTLLGQVEGQKQEIADLKTQLSEQGKYLESLLGTLKKINKPKPKPKKVSPYDQAMRVYRNGRYADAKPLFEKLETNKAYKGNLRARLLHNMALTEFMLKNDENALVYFSKLYSEFPSSNYNANGLLFMAKTFQRQKRNDEAKATLQELIAKFPKSKKVTEAKKLLKVL